MQIQELVSVGAKTTMRIGGQARFFAELQTQADVEEAVAFAQAKHVPLIVLGGGSNTIFADGVIEALVVRLKADALHIDGTTVTVQAGKILGSLLNELAAQDLDLSALTGIPGTVGGAIFGNAGQGFGGTWIDSFVRQVTVFASGQWQRLSPEACHFRYRESGFKEMVGPVVVWEVVLDVPRRPGAEVRVEIERLLQRRIETQPHVKTAGSCFKSLPDGTPAWKLIDAAGLRGTQVGGVQIAEKHANFLLNTGGATFADVQAMTDKIRAAVPQIAGIEMRLYGNDGTLVLPVA
jgi:UDP-N-acetylenolpyruvoylglucosamine reductase